MRTEAAAATRGQRLHSIGVTWSEDADLEASLLLKSLTESGFDNVVPIRLPEATEALAWGIAEVIGHDVTAVCVIEPETVILLVVHSGEGAVQTAVNHSIDTEKALLRWVSTVFTRADWRPQALVVVGSGGDLDALMPRLENILGVPVYAPAEAELALARGAALASAHNSEYFDVQRPAKPAARERKRLAHTGPLAMLVAGAVTFVVSASAAISLELTPERTVGASEPSPAAKSSPDVAAAAQSAYAAPPPAALPEPVPVAEALPPAGVGEEGLPADIPAEIAAPEAAGDAVPPEAPVDALPPEAQAPEMPVGATLPDDAMPPPAPGLVPADPTPVPQQRRGILNRIRDRLSNIGQPDEPDAPAPLPEAVAPVPPDPAAVPAPEAAPAPADVAPAPEAPAPPPEEPLLLPPQ